MNYFKNAAQMTATYGEDSANQIFDMGAVYYYLIDNRLTLKRRRLLQRQRKQRIS